MGHTERVQQLEDDIAHLKQRLDEMRQDRDNNAALVAEERECVADSSALIDSWIDAFDMEQDDKGEYCWREGGPIQERDEWEALYHELRRDWNKFVPDYNAVVAPRLRNFGRPLAASETQR